MRVVKQFPLFLGMSIGLSFACPSHGEGHFYSDTSQGGAPGAVVNAGGALAAVWTTNTSGAGGTLTAAIAGNIYEVVANGTLIGTNKNNARVRAYGPGSFPGDQLLLDTNTELRFKNSATTFSFVNSTAPSAPCLLLNGGLICTGDGGGSYTIAGQIQAAPGTTSYLCTGNNDFAGEDTSRNFIISGQLSGSGTLVVCQGGIAQSNIVLSGNSNGTFTGQWIDRAGWLVGLGTNSLGAFSSITIDPQWPGFTSPPFDSSIAWNGLFGGSSSGAVAGPAMLEVWYDINSTGALVLTNGGMMKLHQNCIFDAVEIEGASLSPGTHPYSELASNFPNNFAASGSGSIIVQPATPSPPTIGTQPVSQTLYIGQTAQFTVIASGTAPLFYQWRARPVGSGAYTNLTDGGQLSGSTTYTLTLNNLTLSNTANFVVVITNSLGSITSSVATLNVTLSPPVIVTQPLSQTLFVGQSAQFAAGASGALPLYYQWMAGAHDSGVYTNLTDGGQVSGSASSSLTVTSLTLSNSADFIVVVSNSVGAATSSVATLTVLAPSAVLQSTALVLSLGASPFDFNVVEKSTGLTLLAQTANQFTLGGTSYSVSAATNLLLTSTTLDADLVLSGTSATGHITFNFIQPGIIQTTLSSSNNNPSQIFQQFADQGEDIFGAREVPYNATLSERGNSWQLIGGQGVTGIDQGCGAHAPFYVTTRHYGIYVESQADGTMTFAQSGQTSFSFPVSQLTYDIIYGPAYAAIMAGFNRRTVPSYMPPTWAFDSIWWKDDDHNNFPPGVTNAQGNVLDTAIQLTNHQIHASSEWIDRPYGTSCGQGDGGWGNMDFDSSFPNPAGMVSSLQGMGYNLMLWISDLCWCDLYNEALGYGWLFYTNNDSTVSLQNSNAYHWFQTNLNVFVNLGVMGYKIDRGDQGEMPNSVQNLNDTLFEQLAWQGLAAVYPTNSFIFSRSASDTGRPYTALWNGDTFCTFSGLQYSIISSLRAGIINFPMWGSDTGGYIGTPTEELFDRWLEFSAYSSIMEVLNGGGRTPWYNYSTNFSSPTNIVAVAAAQAGAHHDLIPYTRSWLYQATQNGMPVMRSVMFGYPNDANEAATITNCEYLFGPNILVAPVITAGATNRNVYLPSGLWLDYNSKSALYVGPTNLNAAAPLQTIPLLVNEGAIIPRGDIWQGNNLWTSNWTPYLRIEFFPSESLGSSCPYYTGSSVQNITCTNQNHTLTIQFGNLGLGGNLQVYVQGLGAVARDGAPLRAGIDYTYIATQDLLQVPFNGATTLVVSNAEGLFEPFEAWQTAYFGNFTNAALAGPSANPAGDGIPNLEKYAFGLNPLVAASNALSVQSFVNVSATNYLALTFQRATNATDTTLTVLAGSNLLAPLLTGSSYSGTNIISNTANTTEVSRTLSNNLETITVRDNVPMSSATERFMRLRVTRP